jgi:hypothetical protein
MKRLNGTNARKLASWTVGALLVVVVASAFISTSHSSVTRARLERDVPRTFANLYVQQAALLGHKGITVHSMHAKAQCDKGGPGVPDRGPGADWICYMSWKDPNVDQTLMPGKFEVNAHSNNCYTAGGPSKLVGLLTITDKRGQDVPNPVFEFDGCFDPNGSSAPTGVSLEPTKNSPTGPAAITVATTALRPDVAGVIRPAVTCAPGQEGCGGTIAARLDGQPLDPVTYALAPDSHGTVELRLDPKQAAAGGKLVLVITPVIGDTAASKVSLSVQ